MLILYVIILVNPYTIEVKKIVLSRMNIKQDRVKRCKKMLIYCIDINSVLDYLFCFEVLGLSHQGETNDTYNLQTNN